MLVLLLVLALVLVEGPATSIGAAENQPWAWQEFGRGLSYTQIEFGKESDKLLILKIDPNLNAFRIWHGSPKSIHDWQEKTGASIVFNGGYYTATGKPSGLIVSDGKIFGPRHNPDMKGMFVAEPKGISPDLPRAAILDLATAKLDLHNFPWSQGLMSYPLLLDSRGIIRVKKLNRRAPRTIVATDRQGNILIVHAPNSHFSLFDLARFLKNSDLNIEMALNLDGGSQAQVLVNTKSLRLISPSWLESGDQEYIVDKSLLLPTVVGVFPRQD